MSIIRGIELYRRHQTQAWVTVDLGEITLKEISVSKPRGAGACEIRRPEIIGHDAKPRACFSLSGDAWQIMTQQINALWRLTDNEIARGKPAPMVVRWTAT